MWNQPSAERLSTIPNLYETDHIKLKDKLIYLHCFIGSCDWYIAEYSPDEDLFFGYAILNGDTEMAEWGYISFIELRELKAFGQVIDGSVCFMEVDCELEELWVVKPASEIDQIRT